MANLATKIICKTFREGDPDVGGRRDPNEFIKYENVKRKDGNREQRQRQIVLGEKEPLRDPQLREQMLLRDFGLRVDNDDVNKG